MRFLQSLVLSACIATIIIGLSACAKEDTETQDIIDFFNSPEVLSATEQALEVEDGWNYLSSHILSYTSDQARNRITELALKASQAYRAMAEVSPPECLRNPWDKLVEASRLSFEALNLMDSAGRGHDVDVQDFNSLIYEANDIKTQAERELEDICQKYGIELPKE